MHWEFDGFPRLTNLLSLTSYELCQLLQNLLCPIARSGDLSDNLLLLDTLILACEVIGDGLLEFLIGTLDLQLRVVSELD